MSESLSSNSPSLSPAVSSLLSHSIVPPPQRAVCFSVIRCRGSEHSAVSSRTKGYESATRVCVKQELHQLKTMCACGTAGKRTPPLCKNTTQKGIGLKFDIWEMQLRSRGHQLQAAYVKNRFIITDLIFSWGAHCPKPC